MTSSNGNIFCVTGHLGGEFTGPGEFPAQRPVAWRFDVISEWAWINGWVNNRDAGNLRRHRTHCDVILMWITLLSFSGRYLAVFSRTNYMRSRFLNTSKASAAFNTHVEVHIGNEADLSTKQSMAPSPCCSWADIYFGIKFRTVCVPRHYNSVTRVLWVSNHKQLGCLINSLFRI